MGGIPVSATAAALTAVVAPLEHRRELVFAPGTPQESIDQFDLNLNQDQTLRGLSDAPAPLQLGPRWQRTATDGSGLRQGDPTTLTWSIVPDGTPIVGEDNDPSDLVARLGEIYGVTSDDNDYTDEPWFELFVEVFDRWTELSGLTYVYEPNDDGVAIRPGSDPGVLSVRGDVRVGGHRIDGNSGVLAYNYFPNNGDMVIDTDDNYYNNTSNNSLRLRNIFAHELGHGIGLAHVMPTDGRFLMEPFINLNFDGPQYDDILGAHRHYGDVFETDLNDTPAGATELGILLNEQTITIGADASTVFVSPLATDFVSIDGASDVDVFQFQLLAGGLLDVTLTPVGPTYLEGPQFGALPELFDASRQNDLVLELLDQDGTTVLQSSSSGGLGQSESLVDAVLPSGGIYFVRVSGSTDRVQTYQLDIVAETQTAPLITGPQNPTNEDPFDISINFFGAVTGFDQADLSVTNGSVVSLEMTDPGSGQFSAQIDADADGEVVIVIAEGAAFDETSTPTAASPPFSIVIDTAPPILTVPDDLVVEANTTGGATRNLPEILAFLGGATASDALDPAPTISDDAPPVLPLGDTEVTFTAMDAAGNVTTGVALVTVVDTRPPTLSLPPDSTLEGDVVGGTSINNIEIQAFLARARGSDIVDDAVTVTHDAPDVFPVGDTVVTFTATDAAGNFDTMGAIMTVEDTTPPVVSVPQNIEVEADTLGGVSATHPAIVAFLSAATASDIVTDAPQVTHDAPNIFRIGDTVVVFTATDAEGNRASKLATVTVTDHAPPELVAPEGIVLEAVSAGGIAAQQSPIVEFLAAAKPTDLIDFAVTVRHDAPAVFPLGETVVTFSAADDFGNEARQATTVTVTDTRPPTLSVPAAISVEANARGGYRVDEDVIARWAAAVTAVDAIDEVVTVSHDVPAFLTLGQHAIIWTASDGSGNSAAAATVITVVDTTAPSLHPVNDLEIITYQSAGLSVDDPRIASFLRRIQADDIAADVILSHDAPEHFLPGVTEVNVRATDTAGNAATMSAGVAIVVAEPVRVRIPVPRGVQEGSRTARGPLPTSWATQRHELRDVVVQLGIPVSSVKPGDLVLTNLGVDADREADVVIPLQDDQLLLSEDGRTLTISLPPGRLADGVYRLDLLGGITGGAPVSIQGNAQNRFYALTGDWNGDAVFDAADLAVLGYWNGVEGRPAYARLSGAGELTAAGLDRLAGPFGRAIRFPGAEPLAVATGAGTGQFESLARSLVNRLDVNGDGKVTGADALHVVNRLSGAQAEPLAGWSRLDVNGDGWISPQDALLVINRLATTRADGEAAVAAAVVRTTGASAAEPAASSPADNEPLLRTGEQLVKLRQFDVRPSETRSLSAPDASDGEAWSAAVDQALDPELLAELVP